MNTYISFPFILVDFYNKREDISRINMCFFITRIPEQESERWLLRESDREMFSILSQGFCVCNSYIFKEEKRFWIPNSKWSKIINIFKSFYIDSMHWKYALDCKIFLWKIMDIMYRCNLFPDSFFERFYFG